MHAASHIDRKHIAALLRCSYTVDYVDAVLLDERSSLAVPAIHAFLKTFFPKLASHVLTEQTCSIIDNLVSTLTSMVDVVDVQESAHRLTGDLRALALVYSSGADIKPPPTLHAALETLLTRTKAARARLKESKQSDLEAPTKKRKFNTLEEMEDEEDDEDDEEEGSAPSPGMENQKESNESPQSTSATTAGTAATTASTTSMAASGTTSVTTASVTDSQATTSIKEKSREPEEAQSIKPSEAEKTDQTDAKSSSSLITASSTTSNWNNQLCRSMNNVSWLDMLEKTIANLQMIMQFQSKN